MTRAALLLAGALALAGCAYRLAGPPALGESVRVEVVSDDARLVRAQTELQRAVAEALRERLGWQVSPAGTARLQLALTPEEIQSTADDARNIPARWRISIRGTALLRTTRHGSPHTDFAGVGHAGGIDSERAALQLAAENAAESIAAWLEEQARGWTK